MDNRSSQWSSVSSGVPQGSILGPMLFLIYANDISDNISSQTRMFADDCTLFREIKCRDDCIQLQRDLTKIHQWSQTWQLKLNISKCKSLCVSNKKTPPHHVYSINNHALEWVDEFRYLGVHINRNLTWSTHTAATTLKASRILNLLRRTMYKCNRFSKRMAVMALVRPQLEYSAPVWTPHHIKDKNALERVQKRAGHWICSKWDRTIHNWNKSYDQVRNELQWPSIAQRHTLLSCCQTYKVVNSLDCIDFSQYFSHVSRTSRHHALTLSCTHSRINSFRYSFLVNAPDVWNSLPSDIVNSTTYNSFKRKLSVYLCP